MIKALASLVLSLCFCLPGWAAKKDASLDANAIAEEIRNALRDLQIQIPENEYHVCSGEEKAIFCRA